MSSGTGVYMRWAQLPASPWGWFRLLRHHPLGLRRQVEYELEEGYERVSTAALPDWALRSPSAGIVGTWKPIRWRWRWMRLPICPWRRFRPEPS